MSVLLVLEHYLGVAGWYAGGNLVKNLSRLVPAGAAPKGKIVQNMEELLEFDIKS